MSLYSLAKKYNPNVKLVLAEEIGGGPICAGRDGEIPYGAGCKKIFEVQVDMLILRCVEFDTVENAQKEAFKLKEYSFKNWLFDEVTGEPPLEKFVKEAFGAIDYNKIKELLSKRAP
tara:strand:- start:1402 stop:1752 length:351 start_codon:yes stop_codon:yes gene_type:complete